MKVTCMMAVVALVSLLASGPVTWAEDPVHFDDPDLKAAVEWQLGKADPTPTDMASLTGFYVESSLGISDLTGLEYATNLTELKILCNQISDLSPLRDLTKLTYLDLNANQISNLSPLAGLTNLNELALNGNQISNLSSLAGLTKLRGLFINRNQISYISPLSGLTELRDLDLSNNQISDISSLVELASPSLWVNLKGNPLAPEACAVHIREMESQGARFWHDACWDRVPDVVGMSLGEAKEAIWSMGWSLLVVYAPHAEPFGQVIAQDPEGGRLVEPGVDHPTQLTVSSGPDGPAGPATACLVAHWKLDETSGATAADASNNHYDGTVSGGPLWQPAGGRLGGALQFDGVNDYIDCGNPIGLKLQDQITLACWIKVAAFHRNWETILAKGDDSYRLGRSSGTGAGDGNALSFGVSGTSAEFLDGAVAVTDNEWHHVAAVYDGAQAALYVDGVLDNAVPAAGRINAGSYPLFLGESSQTRERYFSGLLDEVRVYRSALSAADVARLAGATANDPNLVGWWKMDETSGDVVYDGVGQNDGIVYGGPSWEPAGGKVEGALRLDGVDDYAELPIGSLIGSLTNSTFATWVNWSSIGRDDERIFDFGSGGMIYMFLTPRASVGGSMRFIIRAGDWTYADQTTAPQPLTAGWHHVAVTIDAASMVHTLHLDGQAVATREAARYTPSALSDTTQNCLGRSQHMWDPYFHGLVDDFRIYSRTLSPAEVARLAAP